MNRPWIRQKKVSNRTRTNNDNRKIYDSSKWRNGVRVLKLKTTPYCEICLENDILTEAKEVDHIKPISEGGEPFDIDNLQALCTSCHAKKSAKEGNDRH